ncbi:EamA family transporter [Adhaeribacter terreus]|uniref:EamA family transporter n=1 Tax=Adhaeribacter terreus TaxID=529703 RepID=A0ABW0EAK4_9BACT
MKTNKYYAAAIAAFVIWGFIPFPLRALTQYPSGQILYFRILISVFILLLLIFTVKRKEAQTTWRFYKNSSGPEKRKMLLLTLAGGALLTLNWLLFIYVINHISIQTASFSYLLCPILTAVLGFLILKEPLRKNQWAAIGLSLLSCGLIGVASFTNLVFSLLIAASYAFYLISQRVLKDHDKIVLLTLQLILGFIIIAPFYNYLRENAAAIPELQFFGPVLILSVVFTVLPLFLNLFALQELRSGTIGILMYLNPIINFMLAFLYFGEETTVQQGLAYALIFLSIILYNLKPRHKKTASFS